MRPFAARIGLAFVPLACKPLPVGLLAARLRLGVPRRQMAMVGDQIFTDRLAAGLFGIRCLYVLPRTPREKSRGVRLKRKLEPPFVKKYFEKGGKLYE